MIEVLSNLKLIFFILFFLVLYILEFYFSNREWESRRLSRLLFHSLIAIINTILMRIPSLFLILPALLLINENDFGLMALLSLNFLTEAIICFLLLDFAYYWWHRFNHTNSFLWRFHSVHHLDTHVDVTTALRFHFGELLLSSFYKVFLILVIGTPISIFIFFEIILSASTQFHHSNIKLPSRLNSVLMKIIVTPEYHTNHHTVTKKTRDANYSSIFTIWDKIFFTLKDSNSIDRVYLGLNDRNHEFGIIANLKYPFKSVDTD